mmetsp:Transcript_34004/g.67707  ORF Transcript_34004/g.67707 Transcript_34004/m.67707 type:complete len:231 (+) Transcript_34004:381-1073(+)
MAVRRLGARLDYLLRRLAWVGVERSDGGRRAAWLHPRHPTGEQHAEAIAMSSPHGSPHPHGTYLICALLVLPHNAHRGVPYTWLFEPSPSHSLPGRGAHAVGVRPRRASLLHTRAPRGIAVAHHHPSSHPTIASALDAGRAQCRLASLQLYGCSRCRGGTAERPDADIRCVAGRRARCDGHPTAGAQGAIATAGSSPCGWPHGKDGQPPGRGLRGGSCRWRKPSSGWIWP